MTDRILSKTSNYIGWIVFNNPERRNAISLDMAQEVARLIAVYNEDPDVRVVVIKGEGGKAFISGQDISEFEKLRSTSDGIQRYETLTNKMYDGVRDCTKPVIAMIEGYCMGGGVALACASDIRICSDNSIFAIPAARLGIGYRPNFTRWLLETIGASNTKEVLFTGRRYDAAEALQIGLVNRVIPVDDLENYVSEYIKVIAENAPLSIRAAKYIINSVHAPPGDWDLTSMQGLIDDCSNSDDYIEGRQSFIEKRIPNFTGK